METPMIDERASDHTIRTVSAVIRTTLAVLTTIGLFSVIAFMLLYPLPDEGHDAMMLLTGALAGGWATILGYYFGSSAGSEAKNALLNK